MTPLISIILPTFNRASFIKKAIDSILHQTHEDFELIIVDDGSMDDTRELVNKYKDPRVRYFWKKNEERNFARNFGIDKAKGRYITFLDSDDYLYPNHFSEAEKIINRNSSPIIIHLGYEIKNKDGETIKIINDFQKPTDYLLRHNYLSCNAIFIRKDVIQQFKFIQSKSAILGEDHYVWLRILARYELLSSKAVTSVVLEHNSRSLREIDVNKLVVGTQEIINSLRKDQVFLEKHKGKAQMFFSFKLSFVALVLAENEEKERSYQFLLQALRIYPKVLFYKRFLAALKNTIALEFK